MHTVSGKITRAPRIQQGQNQNGTFTSFLFEISERNKGYNGEQDSYTNYSVGLFPKSQAQIDFHMKAIAEGSFVVISADKLKIDISNVEYPKLQMQNPRLEGFLNPSQQQGAPNQQVQGGQQAAPQQAQQSWGNAPQQAAPAPQQQQAPQMAPAYQPAAQQSAPQQPAPRQSAPQQAPKAVPAQYNEPSMDFDDDIPF